ncbi:MAG TPA: fatty acid desaturase [Anaerolineales bacterium]|nr:fatty acid desaturase [Anaerolineales bacterium]
MTAPAASSSVDKSWLKGLKQYEAPTPGRSAWQIANSVIPYIALFYLAYRSLEISYWLTLLLATLAAGFMVRIFIIFHDCCHGSFTKSQRANRIIGTITGIITFTPYDQWKHSHAVHHATAGDLDRRGVGDVYTMTADEYLALPPIKRLGYRLYRFPLVMFGLGSTFVFLIGHRFWHPKASPRERMSVIWTNLALLGIFIVMSLLIGWREYILVQFPILFFAAAAGVWLFYVQHQFESVYWERHERWDFIQAATLGASYYKLPPLLQWFTGNIGFHHIHHLNPRIPNYLLEKCQRETPRFQEIRPITLQSSLKCLGLRLWDEKEHKLVGFGALKGSGS